VGKLKLEPIDTSDILVTAWADDDAIDWDASEVTPEDYTNGKDLEAKTGEEITWFHYRLLTRREDIAIRARFGPTMKDISGDMELPLAKLEAMALEAARVGVVEIEGDESVAWKGSTLPDRYVDGKGAFSQALFYVGEKVLRLSRLSEEEANF